MTRAACAAEVEPNSVPHLLNFCLFFLPLDSILLYLSHHGLNFRKIDSIFACFLHNILPRRHPYLQKCMFSNWKTLIFKFKSFYSQNRVPTFLFALFGSSLSKLGSNLGPTSRSSHHIWIESVLKAASTCYLMAPPGRTWASKVCLRPVFFYP